MTELVEKHVPGAIKELSSIKCFPKGVQTFDEKKFQKWLCDEDGDHSQGETNMQGELDGRCIIVRPNDFVQIGYFEKNAE